MGLGFDVVVMVVECRVFCFVMYFMSYVRGRRGCFFNCSCEEFGDGDVSYSVVVDIFMVLNV